MNDLRTRLRAVPTLTGTPPGRPDRRHVRLRYNLDDTWTKELLWP